MHAAPIGLCLTSPPRSESRVRLDLAPFKPTRLSILPFPILPVTLLHLAWLAGWLLGHCGPAVAADWPAFRGPRGDGVSTETEAPLKWDPDHNIVWKTPLPTPGNGSPIVAGDRVWIAGPGKDPHDRTLQAFDRATGQLLWSRSVRFDAEDPTHRTNPHCSSTPATAGERVVIWHGSAGLLCYDRDGAELWRRDLGAFRHIWGYGSSPVIWRDRVILNAGPGVNSLVAALDLKTGQTLWELKIPGGASGEEGGAENWVGSWSTPTVVDQDGSTLVVVSLPGRVVALDAGTGEITWSCEGLGQLVYTSAVVSEGVGLAMGGYHGPALGFRLGGRGDVTATHRLWQHTQKNPQRIGTGVVLGPHLYMANEQFLAQCLELQTGREIWSARLPQGTIWGSLVRVGDRLYVTNQAGTTVVFRATPEKLELLAENPLGETSNSTIAVSNGKIYLRTHSHLYAIGSPDGAESR